MPCHGKSVIECCLGRYLLFCGKMEWKK